jgi:prepilin-type N-terminal cleavage/methylation domain-containing protein
MPVARHPLYYLRIINMSMLKRQRGFSLVELVLVIMIIGVLSVFISKFIAATLNSYINAQNVTDTTWQLRLAYIRLLRDIRQIRSPSDVTNLTSNELTFVDMSGASFDYIFNGTQLTLNGQVLADGISGGFSYFTNTVAAAATASVTTYVTFTMTDSQKGANISFTGTAELRNFSL